MVGVLIKTLYQFQSKLFQFIIVLIKIILYCNTFRQNYNSDIGVRVFLT